MTADRGAGTGVRRGAAAVPLLVIVGAFAGCFDQGPDLPPVFAVDEIRYWWEEDFLIVNLTIRNQANFTPGRDAHNPWLRVLVQEYYKTGEWDHDMRIYGNAGGNEFTLYFEAEGEAIPGRSEWQDRYYDRSAREALGVQHDANYTHSGYGPVEFPPNASISPEIVFKPGHQYEGLAGHYSIQVRVLADEPIGYPDRPWTKYYTGCFNLDTPEFYGVKPGFGQTCSYWTCEGDHTGTPAEHVLYQNGMRRPLPPCQATEHEGPVFEE